MVKWMGFFWVHVFIPFLRAIRCSRFCSTYASKFSYTNSLQLQKFIGLEIVTSHNGGRLDSLVWTDFGMTFSLLE